MPSVLSHRIAVNLPVHRAFPLFTPKGEEDWVPEWVPTYVEPPDGRICVNMLFTTGSGDEKTFWTCTGFDQDKWTVCYFRLTPASRAAHITVQCRPEGPDNTTVKVTYELHALTESGHDYLERMTPEAFASMIDEWASWIAQRFGVTG